MKHESIRGLTLAMAAAALFNAGVAFATTMDGTDTMEADVKCTGVNSCKGKSECKTAQHACKGQNSCKGEGIKMMSKKECMAAGGTVVE